jgi:Tat protein translocase TatB subunit
MFNMNPFEMVVIAIIALVVVGPKGLPELGRALGKWTRMFRDAADEMKRNLYVEDNHRSNPSYRRIPAPTPSESKPESTEPAAVSPVEGESPPASSSNSSNEIPSSDPSAPAETQPHRPPLQTSGED